MKLQITAKPRAREQKVTKVDDENYIVAVKEPPVQGRANAAIIKALAEYFHTAPTNITILSGHTSRHKVINIT